MKNSGALPAGFGVMERELMETSAQRIATSTGVKLKLSRPVHDGQEYFRLAINDPGLGIHDKEVFIIVSATAGVGQPFFWLVDHERRPIGAEEVFHTFGEAIQVAEVFALMVIRTCKDLANEQIALKAAASASKKTPADPTKVQFTSKVLTTKELVIIQQFSTFVARFAHGRGLVHFQESPIGIFTALIGVIDAIDREYPLGVFCAANKPDGGYVCTVKCVDGSQGPWAESFSDIRHAIYASRKYFEFMATGMGRTSRPSLLDRIKWMLGLRKGL